MKPDCFYITTPIYYVNDTPHIGHAYTTIVADVLTRYHKLFGDDAYMLTGTDEHGQKVQNAAKARGKDTQEHVDEMVLRFQNIWRELQIEENFFIRTTMPMHKEVVRQCLDVLFKRGEIYAQEYEGWYSVSEEIFYMEKDLVDGKSPAGKEVAKLREKNYFFRMSKYQQRLIDYIEAHPDFIQPEGKRSEVLGFLRQPLNDLCISRPKARLNWGIDLPFDSEYVTYVWFDALLNYVSAVGFLQGPEREAEYRRWWPHARHLIGKDILMTHAVYWPTMLMALEMPLPRQIFAHGWWLNENSGKMSKSEGPVVAPLDMKNLVGVDAFRYFLTRDIYLGNDAQFSKALVINRVNAELANNLGNLLSRSLNLVEKFFAGKVPSPAGAGGSSDTAALSKLAAATAAKVEARIRAMQPNLAIEEIVSLLTATNKYLEQMAPWKTAKTDLALAGEALNTALEVLRIAGILLLPVMPTKMDQLLRQLGWQGERTLGAASRWGLLPVGAITQKGDPLFPRIESTEPAD